MNCFIVFFNNINFTHLWLYFKKRFLFAADCHGVYMFCLCLYLLNRLCSGLLSLTDSLLFSLSLSLSLARSLSADECVSASASDGHATNFLSPGMTVTPKQSSPQPASSSHSTSARLVMNVYFQTLFPSSSHCVSHQH